MTSIGMAVLLVLALGGCGTARPQTPEPDGTPTHEPAPMPAPMPAPAPVPAPVPVPEAMQRMADACARGPTRRCADVVALVAAIDLEPIDRTTVVLEQSRIAVWSAVDQDAIGVLLPLTGAYAEFGIAAREALTLALEHESATHLRLVVRDTEGNAEKAAAQATELITQEKVALLVGPIGRKESAAVSGVARFFAVPQVTLASDLPPPDRSPDPVLRLRTSPGELVAAVARHAKESGLARAALLVPIGDAGSEAAAAFRREYERLGGTIIREVSFDPAAKDYDDALKALVAFSDLPPNKRRASKVKPDFDALFIPASAPQVRRVVPALAYWGVRPKTAPESPGVQLLGGAQWNSPTVVDKGEHLTDNAIFADTFLPESEHAQVFTRGFYLRFQRRPTAFQAEVWDATRFVVSALAAPVPIPADEPPRLAVRDTLLAPRLLQGATGLLDAAGGAFVPRVHLLTIHGDTILGFPAPTETQ